MAILLGSVSFAVAQERVIGLLTLPEVFGAEACDEFSPEEVPLYDVKGSEKPIGAIGVTRYWTFPDAGGCKGLEVSVYDQAGDRVGALPAKEFDYAAPAAIVLEEQNPWFRLSLPEASAWVRGSEINRFYPLEVLLRDRLTYMTEASERTLLGSPGGLEIVAFASNGDSVRVVDTVRLDDQLWLFVEVLSQSVCESVDEPGVVSRGWLPAHGFSGEPSVWFHSRGC